MMYHFDFLQFFTHDPPLIVFLLYEHLYILNSQIEIGLTSKLSMCSNEILSV